MVTTDKGEEGDKSGMPLEVEGGRREKENWGIQQRQIETYRNLGKFIVPEGKYQYTS